MNTDNHARTRERAYRIWEGEGRPEGRALQHWIQAEAELSRGATAGAERPGPERKRKSPTKKRS